MHSKDGDIQPRQLERLTYCKLLQADCGFSACGDTCDDVLDTTPQQGHQAKRVNNTCRVNRKQQTPEKPVMISSAVRIEARESVDMSQL
jgi:hypothetical protein